jgi:hypothetical protein
MKKTNTQHLDSALATVREEKQKATARPWRCCIKNPSTGEIGIYATHRELNDTTGRWGTIDNAGNATAGLVAILKGSFGVEVDDDNANLIVTAVNEHSTLCAVADLTIKMQSHFTSGGTRAEYIALDAELNKALAALAAVRK